MAEGAIRESPLPEVVFRVMTGCVGVLGEVRARLAEDFFKICCMVLHFSRYRKVHDSAQGKFGKRKGMVFLVVFVPY